MYKLLFIFSSLFFTMACMAHPFGPYVDFDQSMRIQEFCETVELPFSQTLLSIARNLYAVLNPWDLLPNAYPLIPKKIHQIWLGSEFPEHYRAYQQSIIALHPDWEYTLWTDADVASFNFINKDLFDKERNYGAKSDIWRYEILSQYGGVYIDVDVQMLKPLDPLHTLYHFYIGIQPLDTSIAQLGIGIIGSIAHHPMLDFCIKILPSQQFEQQIIMRTGPIFFTRVFTTVAGKYGLKDIALPSSFFYPRGYTQPLEPIEDWLYPEAFAVHHWGGSWLSPSAFQK